MGIYAKYFLPRIIHFACGTRAHMRQREKIVPLAHGRVLEVGFGSGLNLGFYDPAKVEHVWGVDPSREMRALAEGATEALPFGFEFVEAPAESIPLQSNSADTAVVTFSLCTIPDTRAALDNIRRVLRSGGQLFFCEHGLAPDENVRKWQNRLDPLWGRIGGGCHLNRNIPELMQDAGFKIKQIKQMYIPGWKPGSYQFWGMAEPR